MRKIQDVFDLIRESNYFTPWENALLGDSVIKEWKTILTHHNSNYSYTGFGENLYAEKVPFVIVAEYLNEVFRYLDHPTLNGHYIKNMVAQAFLNEKLKSDSILIKAELNKKLLGILEEKRELINAHLRWMQAFIGTIVDESKAPELDSTRCHVGRWLLDEEQDFPHIQIDKLHHNLHSMAQSAIRMYRREDYAYFLLLYGDILVSSYQIRDLIINIYFSRRFTSIYRDPLTNLPNYFQIKEDIEADKGDNELFMFNIRDFSKINMLYGHKTGDKIIKKIVERLINIDDISQQYRIYGDEFAIIFPSHRRNAILETFNKEIRQYSYQVKNSEIILSFYGSIAHINPHVLEHCEYGLMVSKRQLGHITDVGHINEEMLLQYAGEITLSQELRLAFMDNRIIPYFQPILDLKSNKITKYEVLMRIRDLNGTILEPAEFLEHLQSMYIYPEVTKLMIQKAFDVFKENNFDFSINLSFADITNSDTKRFIITILKRYPDAAQRCTFELLENEAIHNQKEVLVFFNLLHSYGVKIALDDFGVGYINYDTIFKFDIDYIKIDGFLTRSFLTDHKSMVLMESIITVAKELNAKIITEFIESKELLDLVRSMDIDYAQGYYIGKPLEQLLP